MMNIWRVIEVVLILIVVTVALFIGFMFGNTALCPPCDCPETIVVDTASNWLTQEMIDSAKHSSAPPLKPGDPPPGIVVLDTIWCDSIYVVDFPADWDIDEIVEDDTMGHYTP